MIPSDLKHIRGEKYESTLLVISLGLFESLNEVLEQNVDSTLPIWKADVEQGYET